MLRWSAQLLLGSEIQYFPSKLHQNMRFPCPRPRSGPVPNFWKSWKKSWKSQNFDFPEIVPIITLKVPVITKHVFRLQKRFFWHEIAPQLYKGDIKYPKGNVIFFMIEVGNHLRVRFQIGKSQNLKGFWWKILYLRAQEELGGPLQYKTFRRNLSDGFPTPWSHSGTP